MPINFDLKSLQAGHNIFFETGFNEGGGVAKALECNFSKVMSTEIVRSKVVNGRAKFKKEIESGRLQLLHSDSKRLFEHIKGINERIIFWLDAHSPEYRCPLMTELEAIKKHHIKDHTILIDDVRIIKGRCWGEKGVSLPKIIKVLKEINPEYRISYLDGVVKNDVLIATTV